ncbi:MAG TPA: arsenate reductase ArsC [Candidatus Marinimicrobia bacterium]|nr:arsenate reductase ArsC [Candidatus Neomarinimicrobiota bacterium]
MTMKILILCTGNSCRSQMAEAFLKKIDPDLDVFSAGTEPAERVNPYAVKVMAEIGIDISRNQTNHVDEYLNANFDYVITVCDHARETCPVFFGKVKHRLHIGFDDPAEATGTEEEILAVFRNVRDKIKNRFNEFYRTDIKPTKKEYKNVEGNRSGQWLPEL